MLVGRREEHASDMDQRGSHSWLISTTACVYTRPNDHRNDLHS